MSSCAPLLCLSLLALGCVATTVDEEPVCADWKRDVGAAGSVELLQFAAARQQQQQRQQQPSGRSYGASQCPCVGIDNVTGTIGASIGGSLVPYPTDTGSRCDAWDQGRYPGSCDGASPASWCSTPWCYVDPCNCDIATMPKKATYLPNGTFQGTPIYYSYATCGGEDAWTATNSAGACVNQATQSKCEAKSDCAWANGKCGGKEAQGDCSKPVDAKVAGDPTCRCIAIGGKPGTVNVSLGGGDTMPYPADLGAYCAAWDANLLPGFCDGDSTRQWCYSPWCYVDPCTCGIPVVPKKSGFLPGATVGGTPLYYSYATCSGPDYWTASNYATSCAIRKNATACGKLDACVWTGSQCLGEERAAICTA